MNLKISFFSAFARKKTSVLPTTQTVHCQKSTSELLLVFNLMKYVDIIGSRFHSTCF